MAKVNGLNVRLYVEGYDLSGDANALNGLGYTNELLDVTTLDVSAKKRIVGMVDGEISVDAFFDPATSRQHAVWSSNSGKLPTADQEVLVPMGSAVGDPCVGLVSKQGTYSTTRSPGSAISASARYTTSDGSGLDFGEMLTAHDDTHSSAGSGTVVDSGASSSNGGAGYLQILSLASGSVTVNLQESTSSSGSYSNFMTFSTVAAAAAPSAERLTMEGTVQRYIKVTTTGTFSDAVIAVGFARL
jgi:hypothetical protein